jgi:hypothetical protein
LVGLGSPRADPRLRDVLLLALGVGGLVMCVTLVFLGMRSVMDVGGACADGGPYVSAQSCPEGSAAALLLGIFGGFGFGALAMAFGAQVGGLWTGAAILIGWSGLFASLGWNFLDYGWFNPPPGEGVVWGWLIPGILFEAMALGPVVLAVGVMRGLPRTGLAGRGSVPASAANTDRGIAASADMGWAANPSLASAANPSLASTANPSLASAAPPVPGWRSPAIDDAPPADDATESTTALLDRLERLADLRDRGLLGVDDYETAKTAVMRQLEARR